MAQFSANPLLGGFVGLGEALAEDFQGLFTGAAGVPQQKAKPVSSPNFSFNFGEAVKNITKPIVDLFNPYEQSKNKVTAATGNAVSDIIRGVGDVASGLITQAGQRLQDSLQNNNKQPTIINTTTPTPVNPQPAFSGLTLSQILPLLSGGLGLANPAGGTNSAVPAAQANISANTYLIAGALVLGALVIMKGKN